MTSPSTESEHPHVPVVDTIVHFFEPPRQDRPHAGMAAHHRVDAFAPDDLFPLMEAAGVHKAIQVTSGTMGFDNRYSVEVAARHPDRVRVVARFDARAPDVEARLAALLAPTHVVGVRLTFQPDDARITLSDDSLDAFWAAAQDQAAPVELYVPGEGALVAIVARRFPNLSLMVDHVGIGVFDPTRLRWQAAPLPRWSEIFALVPFENVTIRVSAIPEMTYEPYPFEQAQSMLRELRDHFGAERLMWGSNYPPAAATCAYDDLVRWIREGCPFLTAGEKDLVLGGNALRVLRLEDWT
jgi:predicted TIM-barrel fold metal-dependent hydrolase